MLDKIQDWELPAPTWLGAILAPNNVRSAAYLALSFIVNFYAGHFATKQASNSVTDILLDNLPVVRVDFIFIDASILLWVFVCGLLVYRPQRIPFVFKSLALFVLVRSAFIILTHLGPFPVRSTLDTNEIIQLFTFGSDLFFSGHTGAPFLLALIFWRQRGLRVFFLVASVVFGASVLLGHLHYSIDVFAAYFITYGTFDLAKFAFPREHALFEGADGRVRFAQIRRSGRLADRASVSRRSAGMFA
ncbi:phosphatase PAP2-related protein [Mesorhizobium atlanticum]